MINFILILTNTKNSKILNLIQKEIENIKIKNKN